MATPSSDSHSILQKLINSLSTDLRLLSTETKKKYPPIKEVKSNLEFYSICLKMKTSRFRQQKHAI